jgi:pimeloyl-ACP methyl ester carboxylesterase
MSTAAPTPSAPPITPRESLDDLHARLRAFRAIPTADAGPWSRGTDASFLAELVAHWAEDFDWSTQEDRIRTLPWTISGPRRPVRSIHQVATSPTDTLVVLLHGWPDSVLRFERMLPRLTDVNVLVPALPGFPFSLPVPEGGLSAQRMAEAVAEAIADLGYERYILSAGDVGTDVAEALTAAHPERVRSLHLTDVSQYHFLHDLPDDLDDEERDYVAHGRRWQAEEGGYMHLQSTKPATLAVGLGDSPAALAAWLVEKLRGWTDSGGDVFSVFTRDELLTWITAYWVTGAIGTSFTPYAESGPKPRGRVDVPTSFTIFRHDLVNAPRRFAERFFTVAQWSEFAAGGHFAAWERPDDYLSGVRSAVDHAI